LPAGSPELLTEKATNITFFPIVFFEELGSDIQESDYWMNFRTDGFSLLQFAERREVLMSLRKASLWVLILASCGFLQAQPKMLDVPVTVMKETELKIERGECFVFWKPVYCPTPGSGYRLEVIKKTDKAGNPPLRFNLALNGNGGLPWLPYDEKSPKREAIVPLQGRNVLRVTLYGKPGEGITLRIYGEPGQVNLRSFVTGGPHISETGRSGSRPPNSEKPAPQISLKADTQAIRIGQPVKLTWDVQNAHSALFTSGDLGMVKTAGSAMGWPEKDSVYRLEARGEGGKVSAEAAVSVEVREPELEVWLDPQTVDRGKETTLSWKSKNARLVRFEKPEYQALPLSGSRKIFPQWNTPITLVAENGEKQVRRSVTAKIVDMEAMRRQAEQEKARRTIPKEIDKFLQGIWDDLKAALLAGDAEKAASFFCVEEREKYLEIYKGLKDKLPEIGAEMRGIEFIEFLGDGAKYRTKRKETLKGKEYDISYYVFFVIDPDGEWRIYRF
jgi:hypothetical protein